MSIQNEETNEMIETEKEPAVEDSNAEQPSGSDAQEEFKEQYQNLPVWKQVIFLVLCLGGMTAVIMLINFVVDFGAELIKSMFR